MSTDNPRQEFLSLFGNLATHKHRSEVFNDLIFFSFATLRNCIHPDEALEQEYLRRIHQYERNDILTFPKLFGLLQQLLQAKPCDILGPLSSEVGVNSQEMAQYFSPPSTSGLMAELLDPCKELESRPYITLHEPTCGAGGMVLAYVDRLINKGYNPATTIWVQCIDVDRLAAMMCYIQLSLWNVPAEIVVGDSLTLKHREVHYTMAHYFYGWEERLAFEKQTQTMLNFIRSGDLNPKTVSVSSSDERTQPMPQQSSQFDLGFD